MELSYMYMYMYMYLHRYRYFEYVYVNVYVCKSWRETHVHKRGEGHVYKRVVAHHF